MLKNIKRQVRTWEAQGRYTRVTRLLTITWVALHNASDYFRMGRLKTGLPSDDPTAAVYHVVRGPFGQPIRPMQVEQELADLIMFVSKKQPKRLVEIGTARGGTLMLLCRFAAPDATIISVDLPYGRNGGGYPRWKEPIYKTFAGVEQTLHLLRADSHSEQTVEEVRSLLPGGKADFILIDADHSYAGVKTDYLNFSTMIAAGGTIALHDIVENGEDPSIDVARFWGELVMQYPERTETMVHNPDQEGYGLGLLHFSE